MGRAKKRRKEKLKRKRFDRKKRGKTVPFTLSNCPKKLKGRKNSNEHKINVHNCRFNGAEFNRVRYRAGHITDSYFRNSDLKNVDFIFVNLKNTSFKGAKFNQVVFNGCNLTNVDFDNSIFVDTYFVNCKIDTELKAKLNKEAIVINTINIELSDKTKTGILLATQNPTLEKYHILTINTKKVNKVMLQILFTRFTEYEVAKFIKKASVSNKSQFYTVHDYMESLEKFFQK